MGKCVQTSMQTLMVEM